MNLIFCDKSCTYQNNGYCGLNAPALFTGKIGEGCGYFVPLNTSPKVPNADAASAVTFKHGNSL